MRHWVGLVCAMTAGMLAKSAQASETDWHVGVNLRTDLGTRQVRLDGGVRNGRFDWILVVDPLGLADGQYDLDGLAVFRPRALPGWGLFIGHRTTVFALDFGHDYHEKVLVGVVGELPRVGRACWLEGEWGVELAANWVRHGAGMPAEWLSLQSGRHFADLVNLSFFVRFGVTTRDRGAP